jgi:hypothetical protein
MKIKKVIAGNVRRTQRVGQTILTPGCFWRLSIGDDYKPWKRTGLAPDSIGGEMRTLDAIRLGGDLQLILQAGCPPEPTGKM